MRKSYWILLSALLLAFFLSSCQQENKTAEGEGDSLFLKKAYAKEDTNSVSQNSDELYNSRQNAITRAVARVSPAVVGINVMQVRKVIQRSPFSIEDPLWRSIFPELFRDRVYEQKVQSLGSGFLISPDGYLVTNDHVVENAKKILVTMTDGKRYNAKLVGEDYLTDIALLKIEGKNFPYIVMGNSDKLIVGEWVIALGNPFGLFALNDKPTVTVGVVSALDRDWGRTSDRGRLYMDMIQTDAAINHGNSGGPLVNSLGRVIGMNTFIFTGSQYQEGFIGIGFAIPINRIRSVVKEIKLHGGINRNYWLGILKVQDLDNYLIRALRLKVKTGVIVTQVEPGSPAAESGIREEDVITAVNGKSVRSAEELLQRLNNLDLRVGDTLKFKIIRDGKPYTVSVKLKALPK